MHATPSHYNNCAELLTCIEHIRWKIPEACVNACWVYSLESLSEIQFVLSVNLLDFLCNMWGCMRWTGPISLDNREDMFITHLIIIKYQPFQLLSYFSMVVCLMWLYHVCCQFHIYPEKARLCVLLCNLMMCAHDGMHNDSMVVFVCLHITLPHYHHYADISEGIELLKCLSSTFCLECVSKIKTILSVSFHPIYGAVCIQLTHLCYDDCGNTCTLSYTYNGNIVCGSIYNTCPCCL